MRYLPSSLVIVVVGGLVAYATYLTKDLDCLYGLVALIFACWLYPETPEK